MSKELKALEELISFIGNGEIADTHELCEYVSKRKDIIESALKAFEIISDKICVGFFPDLNNEYVYVLKLKNSKHFIEITKEQYDFLKEVLL